ncbi:response regulator transcription factor [Acidipila rosea]|uniref:Winged helix family two component transcriptional regulator n=1 Tax=Acidipila rosea TaxID=768535 RepID=A0A4R1LEK3_9BACT|nr:response regulator transcription factor [Acidipila rosea]MBW4028434.1 response regulator transcription factor [Acidobacteriota bacterium]MBW4046054.1 response regulator transcription factor [Acidobacteriota bacterium]TCK75069.1 winged helix family two component transcriptional regulator [Acidipila rosea]
MRLLVAEDDRALGKFLQRGLEADGHEVCLVSDGQMAVDRFLAEMPDLTILDLNLPRKDGAEVLSFLRTIDSELPILILTARAEPETKVRCLDLGADDCMLKPFSLQELRARCRALLRRRREALLTLRYGNVEMNRVERSVLRAGIPVMLTNKEFALLERLMLNRGRCVSRASLLEQVWSMGTSAGTNVVDVYINYLRRKLDDHGPGDGQGQFIQTVRGQGYRIGAAPAEA